jgi:hypothetical protein
VILTAWIVGFVMGVAFAFIVGDFLATRGTEE